MIGANMKLLEKKKLLAALTSIVHILKIYTQIFFIAILI